MIEIPIPSPGWLVQPAITSGALQDESIVHFRKADDDSPVAESRNVFSTDAASLNEVFTEIPVTDPSYLDSGSSHYVMDLRLVTNTRSTTFGSSSGSTTFGGAQLAGSAGIDGLTACIRTPRGPGRVFWDFPNPRGAGYSHKPENQDNVLHWAAAPVQDTDGVYRHAWGCCNAFKVPNSCDLHVTSSGFGWWACCNWAAAKAGKVPEWKNPCDPDFSDWPNCPLCE